MVFTRVKLNVMINYGKILTKFYVDFLTKWLNLEKYHLSWHFYGVNKGQVNIIYQLISLSNIILQ